MVQVSSFCLHFLFQQWSPVSLSSVYTVSKSLFCSRSFTDLSCLILLLALQTFFHRSSFTIALFFLFILVPSYSAWLLLVAPLSAQYSHSPLLFSFYPSFPLFWPFSYLPSHLPLIFSLLSFYRILFLYSLALIWLHPVFLSFTLSATSFFPILPSQLCLINLMVPFILPLSFYTFSFIFNHSCQPRPFVLLSQLSLLQPSVLALSLKHFSDHSSFISALFHSLLFSQSYLRSISFTSFQPLLSQRHLSHPFSATPISDPFHSLLFSHSYPKSTLFIPFQPLLFQIHFIHLSSAIPVPNLPHSFLFSHSCSRSISFTSLQPFLSQIHLIHSFSATPVPDPFHSPLFSHSCPKSTLFIPFQPLLFQIHFIHLFSAIPVPDPPYSFLFQPLLSYIFAIHHAFHFLLFVFFYFNPSNPFSPHFLLLIIFFLTHSIIQPFLVHFFFFLHFHSPETHSPD
ncbi:unnamed protein product [Acanthosepion pharaonis]|uniref:Uncharacterized protein n=1 Tax=Acanthosepion pharaonis TaxID=158019 RepID=A0A812BLM3_ACAPH|nr:unnamed protein product [Sepia pharaonis]